MAGLFNLPPSRNNKEADKRAISKSNNKKSASVVIKGDGIMEKISIINSMVEKNLGKYRDKYDVVSDKESLFAYIHECVKNGICAIDTETTGLDPILDSIVGMSIYTPNQKAIYIPIHHVSYVTGMICPEQQDVDDIKIAMGYLVENHVKIVMFNAKFDIRVIKNQIGIQVPCYYDGYIAAKCLNENEQSSGLKALHAKYVLQGKETAFNFDSLFHGIEFSKVPIQTGYIYAAHDAEVTYELYQFQLPYLTKTSELCQANGLEKVADVFWDIEMPFIDVAVNLEETGICFDVKYAKKLSDKYNKQKQDNLDNFYRLLEMYDKEISEYKQNNPNNKLSDPISVSSPTQLAILFYDILKIKPVDDKSPRGTGVDILEKIDNPLCKAILEYRATDKLLSTYIDKLPECINPKTNRIHCSINQYGAKTGRLSSDSPNLQNIPSHNHDIRKMFVAKEGYVLLSSDYSQQEPRAMTAMCCDEKMIQAYKEGKDLYAQIASISFNKPYEECLEFRQDGTTNKEGKDRRTSAKSILLGILYGRGIASVAEQLHTTKRKAQEIQDKIFKGFPAIKKFEEDTVKFAEENGYVTTFWGRKRRLPEMQLPEFEFKWKPGFGDVDPLSFDENTIDSEVPEDIKHIYISKIRQNPYKRKSVYEEANANGILIVDNGGKIADATRQCVNSRIQGSAADMSKLAGINIQNNKRLKELGFRLLVPIHDEYLAEVPVKNAKEAAEIFSKCMCDAAKPLGIPISTDVCASYQWYGDEVNLNTL